MNEQKTQNKTPVTGRQGKGAGSTANTLMIVLLP